jgi:glycosyltransferase involved in cell wall biosynthesis
LQNKIKNLLIVSHVVHYQYKGRLFAYEPYLREIEKWAELFPVVTIVSPLRKEAPPGDSAPFHVTNVKIIPQPERGGTTLRAKIFQVISLPWMIYSLCAAMMEADAIHVRCPGNIGLLGVILAPLFSTCLVAKYAGQWIGYPGEAFTVRLQRGILASKWWKGPVTVYGQWPGQPEHVIPFFTSIMSGDHAHRAKDAAMRKHQNEISHLLFVGRLSRAKNVHILLQAIKCLQKEGKKFLCSIVGEGSERSVLESQSTALGLTEYVEFSGALPFEKVLDYYERADALVLVSETEGWPKAIAEGMAFGLACIGSDRGLVPWMLSEGRGLTVPPGNVVALTDALRFLFENPAECRVMGHRSAMWAQQYSLDGLRDAIRALLERSWSVRLEVAKDQNEVNKGVE